MVKTYRLKEHIRLFHEKNFKLKCDICKKGFRRAKELQDHLALKHLEEELYKCSICDKNLSCKSSLKSHIKSVHKKNVVAKSLYQLKVTKRAEIVGKTSVQFDSSNEIVQKMNYKSNSEKFICDFCKKSFGSKTNLQRHMEIHLSELIKDHPDSRKCKHCPRFVLKDNLREHYTKNHKLLRCEDCKRIFFSKNSLNDHKKIHEEPKFTCDFCGKMTVKKKGLETHIKYVHLKHVSESQLRSRKKFQTEMYSLPKSISRGKALERSSGSETFGTRALQMLNL
ncbi:zinc finger Y-chromosomal protein-like [Culicoides brevitarsis]|uniref:zinc finger Y-chromosomal protein-like n=1 Tax=Culicoides brevitarsis TaxID=469753 RepID=UPI00307C1600